MSGDEWDFLARIPLANLEPGDVVHLPKRVASMLTYDPPATIIKVDDCGNGSLVIQFDRWNRFGKTEYLYRHVQLFVGTMLDDPAVMAEVAS